MTKSKKRTHNESNEFMPLTKGKLFESDGEDCAYDWGFKKPTKPVFENKNTIIKNSIETSEGMDVAVGRQFIYKSADPLKLKDDDKEIYMENLSKIYHRSYVYIPSFYELPDVITNTDKLIDSATKQMLESELKTLTDLIDHFWTPLDTYYVQTNRLSSSCAAYKMIVRCLSQYNEANLVFENCLKDFQQNADKYRDIVNNWTKKDVTNVTEMFREAVGNVLLKYKDVKTMSLNKMATESNRVMFLRMVEDNLENVKERVEKTVKLKAKSRKSKEVESEESEVEQVEGSNINGNRPAPKSIIQNKGLVPKRNKIDSNPRIKHRMKFKKALVRYYSKMPRQRQEDEKYEGEQSGIRIGIIKSKKFK